MYQTFPVDFSRDIQYDVDWEAISENHRLSENFISELRTKFTGLILPCIKSSPNFSLSNLRLKLIDTRFPTIKILPNLSLEGLRTNLIWKLFPYILIKNFQNNVDWRKIYFGHK